MSIDNLKENDISRISKYIDSIKKNAYKDIVHIQNNVLNKNPYTSNFIEGYLNKNKHFKKSISFRVKQILLFYLKNFYFFSVYISCFIIFKVFGRKSLIEFDKEIYLIDIFFLVDKINNEKIFKDSYFVGLYEVLVKYGKNFAFLPRLFGIQKNPFKLIKLLITLKDENEYLFEYELLNSRDIFKIFLFILKFPIKQFEIIQKENSDIDRNFNNELFLCLPNTTFEAYVRYLVGKKITKKFTNQIFVISWQEFQNLEKGFFKGINESADNDRVVIYGCEFMIKYENYLSMHITDVDVDLNITPHKTLLNGKYNYSNSKKQNFEKGVSLRYKNVFTKIDSIVDHTDYLALLGFNIKESQNLLNTLIPIKKLLIKPHPTSEKSQFDLHQKSEWKFSYEDIYDLLREKSLVFATPMSGTPLEAVASGVSVLIVQEQENFPVIPLVDFGRSKIWDIACNEDELMYKLNVLINFRKENKNEILMISNWYKNNFFIAPNEENIKRAFEL